MCMYVCACVCARTMWPCCSSRLLRYACRPRNIIAFSLFLVAVVTFFISMHRHVHVEHAHSAHRHLQIKLSLSIPGLGLSQVLNIICKHTLFPDVCLQELSLFSIPDLADPSHLVSLSVQAAATRADEALVLANQFSSTQGLQLLESQCADDCVDLMEDTKEHLNAAISKLSSLQVTDIASLASLLRDVKVWLSAALSYQTACADGFDLAPGSIQVETQAKQAYLTEVIGNGLALVDSLSQLGDDLNSWLGAISPLPPTIHLRRLLLSHGVRMNGNYVKKDHFAMHDGFPFWVSAAERRLLQAPTNSVTADVVVAQDGTGDFTTIGDALKSIPKGYTGRYVIYIKAGTYAEVFNITKDLENLSFIGDGIGSTVIDGSRNVSSRLFNTYRTATVGISGSGFYARDITFRNSAGPTGYQAVALRAAADFMVFYHCSFEGYQDTLYALSSRQFYRECMISGTIDFIFGNAIAVFQDCDLVARLPLPGQKNTVTAQGRKLSADVSGYSFQNCTVRGESNLLNASFAVSTYLGRPWKAYSRTVFLQSQLEAVVAPEGWLAWNDSNPFTDTLYYGEFQNRGPGSNTQGRVQWPGVHSTMTTEEATQFNVENFIAGASWLSSYDVAYQSTLS